MIAVIALVGFSVGARATPSPGIVISDEIIGTTPNSFFVLRTILFHPPTYYAFRERLEFVELSNSDGRVLHRCVVRQTENTSDAAAEKETWQRSEMDLQDCAVFKTLSDRDAAYIVPRNRGGASHTFDLGPQGVTVKDAWGDPSDDAVSVIPLTKVRQLASTIAVLSSEDIPWQTSDDETSWYALIDPDDDGEPMSDICELDPLARHAREENWLYLRFFCWTGDQDVDGANFYLPIDSSVWSATSE